MWRKLFIENDFRYLLYERWSRIRGKFSIWAARFWYGKRFHIQSHYSVWGSIRFLMHGAGRISIGKDFHAVSSRKRSFVTLFSPCQLTTIGPGVIELAEHVGLNGTTIVAREHVFLGKNVMVGPNSIIMDHDGHAPWPPEERWIKKGKSAPVVIEDDVWIGMNSIILKGVTIGRGAIIAASSVVVRDVEAGCLYAGNPARRIKHLDPNQDRSILNADPARDRSVACSWK